MFRIKRLLSFWNVWIYRDAAREDAAPVTHPFDDLDESPLTPASTALRRNSERAKRALRRVLRLAIQALLASALGLITGFVGAAFLFSMNAASSFFLASEIAAKGGAFRTFFMLPIAGLVIVFLYKAARLSVDAGTNQVVESFVSIRSVALARALIFSHFSDNANIRRFRRSRGRGNSARRMHRARRG